MAVYYANYVSASRVFSIFLKEVSFKCLYAFVILAAIKVILSVLDKKGIAKF